MNLTAMGFVLVSALLHAGRDYFIKRGSDKQVFSWSLRLVGLLFLAPIFFVYWDGAVPVKAWAFIVASGIVHVLYSYTLAGAYREGDLSLVYPIARSAPVFVLLWSTLVSREPITGAGVVGVLVVVIGAFILQWKQFSWHQVLSPLRATFRNASVRLAWATALLVATYSLIDDRGVELVDPLIFLFLYAVVTSTLYTLYVLIARRERIVHEWRRHWRFILPAGVMSPLGYFLALLALRMERVAYVTTVRQVSIIFGVILGSLLLRESYGRIRFLASAVMFVGMVLIGALG
jgi:drug/metabolite transporter (DMT)-like permease